MSDKIHNIYVKVPILPVKWLSFFIISQLFPHSPHLDTLHLMIFFSKVIFAVFLPSRQVSPDFYYRYISDFRGWRFCLSSESLNWGHKSGGSISSEWSRCSSKCHCPESVNSSVNCISIGKWSYLICRKPKPQTCDWIFNRNKPVFCQQTKGWTWQNTFPSAVMDVVLVKLTKDNAWPAWLAKHQV